MSARHLSRPVEYSPAEATVVFLVRCGRYGLRNDRSFPVQANPDDRAPSGRSLKNRGRNSGPRKEGADQRRPIGADITNLHAAAAEYGNGVGIGWILGLRHQFDRLAREA